jgi:hypothetical protein
VFRFGFLQVLSRIPLVVLGDPQGCPRHIPPLLVPEVTVIVRERMLAHDYSSDRIPNRVKERFYESLLAT